MRVVLYTKDMEPITVVELPEFSYRYLKENGVVSIAVPVPTCTFEGVGPVCAKLPVVTIFSERCVLRGREHRFLVTHDEESALLMKCTFLPGQQAELHQRDRQAFARGFLEALSRIGEQN